MEIPEENRHLETPKRKIILWEDNIKIEFSEFRCNAVDSMHFGEEREQWCSFKHGNEPPDSLKAHELY